MTPETPANTGARRIVASSTCPQARRPRRVAKEGAIITIYGAGNDNITRIESGVPKKK